MELKFELKLVTYFIIAGLSIILIYHVATRSKKTPLLYSFLAFQLLILFWAFHDIFIEIYRAIPPESNTEQASINLSYIRIDLLITCLSSYVWLALSINYAHPGKKAPVKILSILFIPALLFLILHFTHFFDPYLVSSQHMIMFDIYVITCYLYILSGIVLIISHTRKSAGMRRKQGAILSLSAILPLIINLYQNYRLHVLHLSYEVFGLDMTLISFSLTMLFIFIAIYRYRFLRPLPYAMAELFNSMEQPVIIIDDKNMVLSFNNSFYSYFSGFLNIKPGMGANIFYGALTNYSTNSEVVESLLNTTNPQASCKGEILISGSINKCFTITTRPVFVNRTDYIGKVIVFSDITDLKEMINALDQKNSELTSKNDQLRSYSEIVEELAVERERNRIAQDIHDTVGQSMTVLNTILTTSLISCEKEPYLIKDKLTSALSITKEGIAELRRAVSGLAPERLGSGSLYFSLKALIGSFEASGLQVNLNIDDMVIAVAKKYSSFIYRLCQEAMTNALRHGKASHVEIVIQIHKGNLRIYITDNGTGCKEIKKGYGLSGIEAKVHVFNGKIALSNPEEKGFSIYIELPVLV